MQEHGAPTVPEHDPLTVPWKIDDAPEQPLAVIQDTEEGDGVCEIGWPNTRMDRASQQDLAVAKHIVDLHNASLK